jgi:hypothetical protein
MLSSFDRRVERWMLILPLTLLGLVLFFPCQVVADNGQRQEGEEQKEEEKAFRTFLVPLIQEQAQIMSDAECEKKARQEKGETRVGDLDIKWNLARNIHDLLTSADASARIGDLDNAKSLATQAINRKGVQVVGSLAGLAAELLGYTDLPVPRAAGVLKILKWAAETRKLEKLAKTADTALKAIEAYQEAEEAKGAIEQLEKVKEELQRVRDELQREVGLLPVSPATALFPRTVTHTLEGQGVASGDVFRLTVTNTSMCPVTLNILPGTVFAPNDTRYQEMMIGEKYIISLKPGETATVLLFGYCLDPEKLPPAKPADAPGLTYAPLNTDVLPESRRQEYAFFATVIQTGNDLSAADRYTTPLPPQESKKTVIQWTIWHVRKPDIYTQATLEEEVTTQFKDAGADVADPKVQEEIRQGSSQIWASVNLTLKEARTRSTIDISRKASPRDTPLMPTGKNVRIKHSKGLVSVPEEMGATVEEVGAVLEKATYKVGKQNRIWDKDREEITIDVPAAGNKPAQQYVIDHQGFILSHRVGGRLVSQTSVSRDEKGVPSNITRKDFKTNESEKVYVKVHPRTGQAQALMRQKWKEDEGRKSDEMEKEEPYESRWWEKFRDELKKVDLEKK